MALTVETILGPASAAARGLPSTYADYRAMLVALRWWLENNVDPQKSYESLAIAAQTKLNNVPLDVARVSFRLLYIDE